MPTEKHDAPGETPGADDDSLDRYAALETGDGETVLYDREAPSAWIRSDAALDARAQA